MSCRHRKPISPIRGGSTLQEARKSSAGMARRHCGGRTEVPVRRSHLPAHSWPLGSLHLPLSFCRARGFLVAADTRGGGDRVTSEPTRHCFTGVEATVARRRRSDRVMLRRPAISHVTQTAKKHVRHRVCTSGFSKVSTQPQTVRERDSTCVPLPLVRSPSLRLD